MYDLVILGGGPGGLRAAELATAAGMKTVLVEKDRLGGVCLNRGCIPTKALYAHIIGGKGPREGLWTRVESVVDKLRQGSATALRMAGVKVVRGTGFVTRWEGRKRISVAKEDGSVEEISGTRLLLATGARSVRPPFRGGGLPEVVTGDRAIAEPSLWDPERNSLTHTVAILGAGVIAIEMAALLQGLGKEVVLLKRSDQVLRRMDGDIKKKAVQILKRGGTVIEDYVRLQEVSVKEGRLEVKGSAKDEPFVTICDRLIIASSMEPALDGFGLEESAVKIEKGAIAVNPAQGTTVEGVYAVGDCTGGAMLAHLAEYQALAAVSSMTGGDYRVDYDAIPACVFMNPEVGAVGLTEEEALARGEEIVTAKAYFGTNGMALALGESDGFVKVVARASDKTLLGVHIMGPEASSVLGEAALAVAHKLTAGDVTHTVHAHPTLCECFRDACSRLGVRA
jgi:dihydrolipoamide dehydrogenase